MMIVFLTVLYMWVGSQLHSSRRSGKERKQPMFLDLVFVCIVQSIAGSVVTCEAQQLKSISVWWGSHKSVCEFVLGATWKRSLFDIKDPWEHVWGVPEMGAAPNHSKLDNFSIEIHGFGVPHCRKTHVTQNAVDTGLCGIIHLFFFEKPCSFSGITWLMQRQDAYITLEPLFGQKSYMSTVLISDHLDNFLKKF